MPARGLRHEGHEQILRFFRVEDLDRIESGDPADAEVGHPRPRRVSSAFHSGTLGSPLVVNDRHGPDLGIALERVSRQP